MAGVRNTACVLALDGIVVRQESTNANDAASMTNGWASLSSYSQNAYRTSRDNLNARVRTVSTRMDESVHSAVMASTNQWKSLHKQGSAWVEQTTGSFRNLGETMQSSIESVQSQFEQLVPGGGGRRPARHESEEEVLHSSDDEPVKDNDDEPNEISLEDNADSSSGEILETLADSGDQKVDDTSLDLLDEANQNERGGDGHEDSSEASISFDETVSEHEVVVVENMGLSDPADDDNEKSNEEVSVDTAEREALFTAANKVIDEEDDSTTTEEKPEQTTTSETVEATTRSEIIIDSFDEHEISEGLDLVPDIEVGDSAALVEHFVVGDINESTKSDTDQELLSGENEAVDDSLGRNDHVAELDEVNSVDSEGFSRRSKESVAVDTFAEAVEQQREDEEDQNVESPESPSEESSKEEEEETPEGNEDISPHSIQVTVEPLALEPEVELEEPSTLQRILRMAAAAGVVIDPSLAKSLGSSYMANRPPLLTAMCPGPPELRMLLSHCQE
jgi:hypothetical protein